MLGAPKSWGHNGLVAYGAHHFVALYDPKLHAVTATLCGHTGRVNSVKWIANTSIAFENRWRADEEEIISAGSDKVLIVWKKASQEHWVKEEVLSGHTDSVNSVNIRDFPDGSLLVASASSDKTVRLWKRAAQSRKWAQVQVINYAPKMVECVAIGLMELPQPGGSVRHFGIVATGGVDKCVHLYVEGGGAEGATQYTKVLSLEGHQDWLRSLEFVQCDSGSLLLASSSQDNKIRLWSFAPLSQNSDFGILLADMKITGTTKRISGKGFIVALGSSHISVLLESVLAAHEDWVYGVAWHPPELRDNKKHQPMCLLSASMDKTMIIWKPDTASGVWLDITRVGELGGNTLGFYGCGFSPSGNSILAHGYNGAFHLWTANEPKNNMWEPLVTVSGHFGPVEDLTWDPQGNYILSVSEDRTARVFAPWIHKEKKYLIAWSEIARPQIHGYDLTCITFVNGPHHHKFVSGADEKVLRVFDAPQTFVDSLTSISDISESDQLSAPRPVAASQPALGLSNKPFFNSDGTAESLPSAIDLGMMDAEDGDDPLGAETKFVPMAFTSPPFEEHLLQATLWPEVMKLYGHGNEIVAVCCSYDGKLIASSCKGTTPETSTIRLWDTSTWKECEVLAGHTLTVTQMAFSHKDDVLLSVSRDRSWCAFTRGTDGKYRTTASRDKAHARILWGCSWTHDDKYFVTASRDKTAKIWSRENWTQATELSASSGQPLTAVEWAPQLIGGRYVLALGDESGGIVLWSTGAPEKGDWTPLIEVPQHLAHITTIRRIRWRPKKNEKEEKLQLATCSSDCSVRLFDILIT